MTKIMGDEDDACLRAYLVCTCFKGLIFLRL